MLTKLIDQTTLFFADSEIIIDFSEVSYYSTHTAKRRDYSPKLGACSRGGNNNL